MGRRVPHSHVPTLTHKSIRVRHGLLACVIINVFLFVQLWSEERMTGFYRVAALTPEVCLANPATNAKAILALAQKAAAKGTSILVTPELALTGATCGDLFLTQSLLDQTDAAISTLRNRLPEGVLLVCGAPRVFNGVCYNGAVLIARNFVMGFVPKTRFRLGDTRMRCFSTQPLTNMPSSFEFEDMTVAITFGLNTPAPDADLVLCLDAEPEGCGKDERRRTALRHLSATAGNAWVYANAGEGESSTDGIYGGHRLCAWEGRLLTEAQWQPGLSLMDFSPTWVRAHRQRIATTSPAPTEACFPLDIDLSPSDGTLAGLRKNPFIPEDAAERATRCTAILQMQVQALWRRFRQIRAKRLVLGLSGGLDSTLALVVCTQLCRQFNLPDDTVLAVTMPGFGTSDRTYNNACALATTLGAELREISIVPTVEQHFKDIGHDPADHSVTYENAQARARTYLWMDIANKEGGLLVGTGDLSEIALGWSTYNGDHMSMYSVNCSVPKTLISHCLLTAVKILEAADGDASERLLTVLQDICDTPVSPELVPGVQHTESIVGRYELHDCFLWYLLRYGCDRTQLQELATLLFPELDAAERNRTLDIFCRRVITQQFKRSCSPDGPAMGGVALSPRGGWMLPSDANLTL